jgi:hypothetical protein
MNYFLDTSIFHELFKLGQKEFNIKINQCAGGARFAAFYTAIELNRGFIQTLVRHYKKVEELQDVASAWVILSNEFGARPSKRGAILVSYMLKYQQSIPANYKLYLASLEIIITDITDKASLLVKQFIGHYGDHALSSLGLYSSNEYEQFLKDCKEYGSLDLTEVWVDSDEQLMGMYEKLVSQSRYKKIDLDTLNFIEALLMDDYKTKYPHIDDLVISLECPQPHKMVAKDRSFETLIPLQGKMGGYAAM